MEIAALGLGRGKGQLHCLLDSELKIRQDDLWFQANVMDLVLSASPIQTLSHT